jgi:hypothetical protein
MTETLPWLEALSYLVTIVGLPLAIVVFVLDRRRDRQTDEEEIYPRLSGEYADFMRLVSTTPICVHAQARRPQVSARNSRNANLRCLRFW